TEVLFDFVLIIVIVSQTCQHFGAAEVVLFHYLFDGRRLAVNDAVDNHLHFDVAAFDTRLSVADFNVVDGWKIDLLHSTIFQSQSAYYTRLLRQYLPPLRSNCTN